MTGPKSISILNFNVFSDDLSLIPIEGDKCRVINTISPNSYGITTKDPEFKQALQKSDYLVLDGVYFAIASLLLLRKNIQRNQGPDLFSHFIKRLNEEKGKAFFLGSSVDTLEKIKQNLKTNYPDVEVMYYSPPFKSEFSEQDDAEMVAAINAYKPDILFVGMTCPKQEKWTIKNREKITPSLTMSIGNVFDWVAGTQKIIHPFWFKLRLGWLIRIFYRPEVFRRNIGNQMKFFSDVILIFLHIKTI